MPISESELIEKAIAGDVRAFRSVVEKHQTFVLALAYRFVRNTADAEDIAQETFIRLWKNLGKYKHEIKLTTWMYSIVTNLCLDYLKSARFRSSRNTSNIEEEVKLQTLRNADQSLMNEELRKAILTLSEELTPKQKAVFVLRDLEALEVDEVCDILKESAANVKSNLYYARQKMSELILNYYRANKNELL
jgi:RNA polymerase sigma-70 factor, ECF subfamily